MQPRIEFEWQLHQLFGSYGFQKKEVGKTRNGRIVQFTVPTGATLLVTLNANSCHLEAYDSSQQLTVRVENQLIYVPSLFTQDLPRDPRIGGALPNWEVDGPLPMQQVARGHALNIKQAVPFPPPVPLMDRLAQYHGFTYSLHKGRFHKTLDLYLRRHAHILGINKT